MDGATLVRSCRERAGLSQRELAHRAGTSAAAICNYERGDRIPRTTTLARIVAATGATLALDVITPGVDLAANGRTLVELLDLVDHLPQRHDPRLTAPSFADLVADRHRAARD
jgi:transcriptional regulator with XRE-family HTH domain